MSYAVFLNGEMLDKETAVRVLGGHWEQKDFSLEGYETKTAPCGKACVEKNGEGRADGAVAWLEEAQLWRLDQWKDIPALQRVSIEGESGESLFVYLPVDRGPEAGGEDLKADRLLELFEKKLNLGGSRKCDLHLLYPCAVSERGYGSDQETAGEYLNSSLVTREDFLREEENQEELCDFFLRKTKCL